MIQEICLAPRNSLVLIMDQTVGEVPENMGQSLLAATRSCIAIGTRSETDGQTRISLSDEKPFGIPNEPPVFDGVIPTPSKMLTVCSVLDESLLALSVLHSNTRVQIWANDRIEPDRIWIVGSKAG